MKNVMEKMNPYFLEMYLFDLERKGEIICDEEKAYKIRELFKDDVDLEFIGNNFHGLKVFVIKLKTFKSKGEC